MYKYQDVAKVGDRIRSYDNERQTRYIEGKVEKVDVEGTEHPERFACFVVRVDVDAFTDGKATLLNGHRIGQLVYVPMQMAWSEYDGRVVKLEKVETHYLYSDGTEVPRGRTVSVDHHSQVFQIQVEALRSVGADELKALIQKMFKVTNIKLLSDTGIVIKR